MTRTYEATAEKFGLGRAAVSCLLRRCRKTGDVAAKLRGADLRRVVDLNRIAEHALRCPDDRRIDRVQRYEQETGRRVGINAIGNALSVIRWT